jgi:hypothetical protein
MPDIDASRAGKTRSTDDRRTAPKIGTAPQVAEKSARKVMKTRRKMNRR